VYQSLWGVDRVYPCGEYMVESLRRVGTVHPSGESMDLSLWGVDDAGLSVE